MKKIILLALCSLVLFSANGAKRKVHTIGDSTMSNYKPAATPKRGWGMYLQAFFNADSVEVNNRGKSGASTRTFYETANLWPSVKQQMSAGDYLIIQFAHNDEKCKGEDVYVQNAKLRAEGKDTLTDMRGTEPNTTYKQYLRTFISEAREMGVTPILMSPICRAYFKEGVINSEGRHDLTQITNDKLPITNKNYVRCMREVAEEMNVPFLDMTARSQAQYETMGQEYCMEHYFNCGDKTHTGAEGGLNVAHMAYGLIRSTPELAALHPFMSLPPIETMSEYIARIERGETDLPVTKSYKMSVTKTIQKPQHRLNMEMLKDGIYIAKGGAWPAGEVDEVATRYLEYRFEGRPQQEVMVQDLELTVKAIGGDGMNMHINYGIGSFFKGVTTVYENTALPNNKEVHIRITQPFIIPAGETLYVRILPWYDSNGKPQTKKSLQLSEVKAKMNW